MYKWSEIFDYKDGELYWKICDSNNVNFGDIAVCLAVVKALGEE